jgi:ferredoxin
MENTDNLLQPKSMQMGVFKSVLISLPMFFLAILFMFQGSLPEDRYLAAAQTIVFVFVMVMFFLIVYTGKTYNYRLIIFVTVAVMFPVGFITNLVAERGSMSISNINMIEGETPFCHIVIPMIIIPAALTKTIIFPGSLLTGFAAISSMIVIWLAASVTLGRGWCSWVCFFGGLDEGFSSIRKRAKIKHINEKWNYMPYAVFAIILIWSAVTLNAVYCEWFCPFKAVSEFAAVTSFKIFVQTVIFASIFLGLVIILPILTKKRTQCSYFCPMVPVQSWWNRLNIIEVVIDKEKCTECKLCVRDCPVNAINSNEKRGVKVLSSCSKCAKCVDKCPQDAIKFHIKGTQISTKTETARILFLYPAYLFVLTIGAGTITGGLYRIIKLIFTGSLL